MIFTVKLKPWLGRIHCRLPPDSTEISELGKFLNDKLNSGHELSFIIQEQHRGQQANQVPITADVIEHMIRYVSYEPLPPH